MRSNTYFKVLFDVRITALSQALGYSNINPRMFLNAYELHTYRGSDAHHTHPTTLTQTQTYILNKSPSAASEIAA